MKNHIFFLPILAVLLSSCVKTEELYKKSDYNSPIFDENYYLIHETPGGEGWTFMSNQNVTETVAVSYKENFLDYGYENNLGKVDKSFTTGILSKLYDGRTRCDGYYQLSRVQLDKTGFGTNLEKKPTKVESFEFVARGGSSCKTPLATKLKYNFEIKLYSNVIYTYKLNNVELQTDNYSLTTLVHFDLPTPLNSLWYYSMKFECVELPEGVTDDYLDKEKDHLAVMLYEVLLPNAQW